MKQKSSCGIPNPVRQKKHQIRHDQKAQSFVWNCRQPTLKIDACSVGDGLSREHYVAKPKTVMIIYCSSIILLLLQNSKDILLRDNYYNAFVQHHSFPSLISAHKLQHEHVLIPVELNHDVFFTIHKKVPTEINGNGNPPPWIPS